MVYQSVRSKTKIRWKNRQVMSAECSLDVTQSTFVVFNVM